MTWQAIVQNISAFELDWHFRPLGSLTSVFDGARIDIDTQDLECQASSGCLLAQDNGYVACAGRVIEETQEHNLGSPENPMSPGQLRAKFDENAAGILSPSERSRLAEEIDRLEQQDDASAIVEWSMPLMRRM